MRALLDTHTVVWATLSPRKLSRAAAEIIADEASPIFVSAVTAWEIATKVRLGKFEEAAPLERVFVEKMNEAGYILLPVAVEEGLRAGRLIGNHGDPFDRMLAAQALAMDIPILSVDAKLDAFGVRRIW